MANNTILAMNALQSNIIREITPLSDKDCFYIAERYKTEFTYPIHNHAEFELNFGSDYRKGFGTCMGTT